MPKIVPKTTPKVIKNRSKIDLKSDHSTKTRILVLTHKNQWFLHIFHSLGGQKSIKNRSKIRPRQVKTGQDSPRQPKTGQDSPRQAPRRAQDRLQRPPRWQRQAQELPRRPPRGPKTGPKRPPKNGSPPSKKRVPSTLVRYWPPGASKGSPGLLQDHFLPNFCQIFNDFLVIC